MKLTKFLLFLIAPFLSFGQSTRHLTLENPIDYQDVTTLKRVLKINPENTLVMKSHATSYGVEHTVYEQYAEGHRIIGASFGIHAKGDKTTVNGQWVTGFSRKGDAPISKQKAMDIALASCEKGSQFYWEVPKWKAVLEANNKGRSLYPTPELVWFNPQKNSEE